MQLSRRSALSLVGCVIVAGCSDDGSDKPVTLPTTSVTMPSTSPSTLPPPPVTDPTPTTTLILPDRHVATADAFVEEFFITLNSAKNTGDFAEFDAMYLPQCTACADLRHEVESWLSGGSAVTGGDWSLLQQSSNELQDGSAAFADALAYRSSAVLKAANGDEQQVSPTGLLWFQLNLRSDGGWLVQSLGSTGAK